MHDCQSFCLSFVVLETSNSLYSQLAAQQHTCVSPQNFVPLQTRQQHFYEVFLKWTGIIFEKLVIDLFRILNPCEPEYVKYFHFEVQIERIVLLSSSYFQCDSVSRQSTKLSSFFIINYALSNPLSAMLKMEYLYAGSLFMLKTMCVYGTGTMCDILRGFGLTLLLPIGMCMLAAYLYSNYIGPKEAKFRADSGFSAFPLYPLRLRLSIPFRNDPVQFFLGLITLQVSSTPSKRLDGKVFKLMEPECTSIHTASLLEVYGSGPKMDLLSSSGLWRLMYSEAMMILTV